MSELGFYRFAKKDPSEVAIIGPNEEAISRGDLLKKADFKILTFFLPF